MSNDHIDPTEAAAREIEEFRYVMDDIRQQVGQVIVGQSEVVEHLLVTLLVGGHCLITGMPGTAKTLLVRTLSEALGLEFNRIQFTPDLMPTDITGTDIIAEDASGQRSWNFVSGPIFTNVLLADEINRTPPKTQAALLEAMQEKSATVRGTMHRLPNPFFVLATQNPLELEGTYPLPEAQLDRFAMKLSIGYPESEDEISMLGQFVGEEFEKQEIRSVLTQEDLAAIQKEVALVEVCEAVRRYLVELGAMTRNHPAIELGLSPRGLITWQRVAQAWAYLQGRDFVIPDDIQAVSLPVLKLRITGSSEASETIIREIIESVAVPNEQPKHT